MTQKIRSALLASFVALLGISALTKSDAHIGQGHNARLFLPVYLRYIHAIQQSGTKGFQHIATRDFVIQGGGHRYQGAVAFAQVDKYLEGIQGGQITITLHHLLVHRRTAIAMTREVLTFRHDSGNTGTWSGTWYWKQTWRRTGKEWRLAVSKKITEKQFDSSSDIEEYTLKG